MLKIGVLDSGIGGITVFTELRKVLSHAEYVYLGDNANLPYGNKSAAQIEKLTSDCAKLLQSKGIDALVVACNTISSTGHTLQTIRKMIAPIPVFGVVEPGVEAVLNIWKEKPLAPVLILGTRATVRSHAYRHALQKPDALILEQACPLLASMIEEGWTDHPILEMTINEYVRPYRAIPPGIALLACTHYPWVHHVFEKALPGWTVINSASTVAQSLQRKFKNIETSAPQEVEWIFTDPETIPEFAKKMILQSKGVTYENGMPYAFADNRRSYL